MGGSISKKATWRGQRIRVIGIQLYFFGKRLDDCQTSVPQRGKGR